MLLLFLQNIISFIIKTRSDGRYLQSNPGSEVRGVRDIRNATSFVTKKVYNNPDIVIIQESSGKNVLNYLSGGDTLITWKYDGSNTQKFKIILDSDGYFQIVQGKDKFLNYDQNSKTFYGGPFRRGGEQGYILITDDGVNQYPKHLPSGFRAYKNIRDDYLNIDTKRDGRRFE